MQLLRFVLIPFFFAVVSLFLTCKTVSPDLPPRLDSPVLRPIELAVIKKSSEYVEAAHLTWSKPLSDSVEVAYYNLLRMFPGDSGYNDNFPSSQGIPASIENFFDPLINSFPSALESYRPLIYRIYVVDELGRAGDTSAPCTLLVVKQPSLKHSDLTKGCFTWSSDVNLSGPYSYCHLWSDSSNLSWTSNTMYTFPPTDKPAEFSACIPDSLMKFFHGTWFYALFIDIGGSQSLKTGTLYVP